MKTFILATAAVAALSAAAAMTPAEASGGCGPYRHRDWAGYCRPGGQFGFAPRPVYGYGYGYGYGWHRHWGPGWGWHHHW